MDTWIQYGLLAAVFVAISDLLRKSAVTGVNKSITILIPLIIAGSVALTMFIFNGYKNGYKKDISDIKSYQWCILVVIGLMMPITHYLITNCLHNIHNVGYAKTIVSLNVLISSIASLYLFKDAKINKFTICGILLVIGGTCLITTKV